MTDVNEEKKTVSKVVFQVINQLDKTREYSSGKAALANLRNSIGRPYSQTIDIWPLLFEKLPVDFLGRGEALTRREQAILTTLQLYAIHQQGVEQSVSKDYIEGKWNNIGESLSVLRVEEDSKSIDRRFNVMITSTTYEELIHHLRQMVRLLRSKHRREKVNYGQLAEDLLSFLVGNDEKVRLNWSKAYYSTQHKQEKGEDNHDK